MKKSEFILLAAMLASGALKAQNPDTVSFRQLGDVFCNIWYDTCACFLNGDAINSSNLTVRLTDPSVIVTIPYNVNHPMLVKGVVMMEAIASDLMYRWDDSNHLPEYALIYQHDAEKDTMILIDSARWDTIKQPKVLGLPLTVSRPDSLYYCHAFTAYFNNPVMVDSTFYVGGTHNSNAGSGGIWTYRPVKYVAMGFWSGGSGCITQRPKYYCQDYGWYSRTSLSTSFPFGGFVPIVEMSDLIGEAEDSTGGHVAGSGRYPTLSDQLLTAVAAPGYYFSHWNDGDTANPRTVHLTQDTTLTATFYQDGTFLLSASSDDSTQGRVLGEGRYFGGDTAILTAIPADRHRFSIWNDGDTANPRSIVVTQDTSFIAFFEDAADTASHDTTSFDTTAIAPVAQAATLFTLAPNPATGTVTVTVGHSPQSGTHSSVSRADGSPNLGEQLVLTMTDAAGREILRKEISTFNSQLSTTLDLSGLAAGTYFVTLSTPTATGTQRLVVK